MPSPHAPTTSDVPIVDTDPSAADADTTMPLGQLLLASDLLALLLSALLLPVLTLGAVAVHVAVGEVALRTWELRRARVASHWATETVGMLRVALATGVAHLVLGARGLAGVPRAAMLVAGTALLLWATRALFRAFLVHQRRRGNLMTDVAVVGEPEAVARLLEGIDANPESGLRVRGVLGDRDDWAGRDEVWLGTRDDVVEVLADHGVRLVIVEPSDLTGVACTRLVRQLVDAGLDVHVASGLQDLDHRSLTLRPLGRMPLLHVGDREPTAVQRLLKRTTDVVGASFALLVMSPLLAVFAVLVKLEDGGPVLYRQDRVGRGGELFPMLKLRSMRPNADRELGDLQADNLRTGPLFKLREDPRVTRVGRIIRASSIDEIPQFVNVLRGEMSMIGPRPALPSEVVEFDEELSVRHRVAPGLTGLWQVEAREEEDFEHYRRLDLYYVHNQSFLLDLTILLVTPLAVLRRARGVLVRRRTPDTPAIVLD